MLKAVPVEDNMGKLLQEASGYMKRHKEQKYFARHNIRIRQKLRTIALRMLMEKLDNTARNV